MTVERFSTQTTTAAIALQFIEAYDTVDLDALRALLHPEKFQFSHHNWRAYAASADEFVAMIGRMAKDVFPGRRYTHIHAMHVIDDVVLLDTSWKGTPIVDLPGASQAGVEFTQEIKSLIIVENGLITEIRDHN